jgi:regulator of ribosome biosynthesis
MGKLDKRNKISKTPANPKQQRKLEIEHSLALSQKSTASMGKFDKKLDGDVKPRGVKRQKETSATGDVKREREAGLKLLDKVLSGNLGSSSSVKGTNAVNLRKAIHAVTSKPGASKRIREESKEAAFNKNKKQKRAGRK